MKGFNKWWKENGQGIGFILGIVYLNAYFLMLVLVSVFCSGILITIFGPSTLTD